MEFAGPVCQGVLVAKREEFEGAWQLFKASPPTVMLRNSDSEYGSVSKILHWAMAVLVIGLLVIGLLSRHFIADDSLRVWVAETHKALGVAALGLAFVRVAWIRYSRAPPLPGGLRSWEKALTRLALPLMYALLIAIPTIGLVMSDFADRPAYVTGLVEQPDLVAKDMDVVRLIYPLHRWTAYALGALLLLHVIGALKHRYLDSGDVDVLRRIT